MLPPTLKLRRAGYDYWIWGKAAVITNSLYPIYWVSLFLSSLTSSESFSKPLRSNDSSLQGAKFLVWISAIWGTQSREVKYGVVFWVDEIIQNGYYSVLVRLKWRAIHEKNY
jgi:hypothetical protein